MDINVVGGASTILNLSRLRYTVSGIKCSWTWIFCTIMGWTSVVGYYKILGPVRQVLWLWVHKYSGFGFTSIVIMVLVLTGFSFLSALKWDQAASNLSRYISLVRIGMFSLLYKKCNWWQTILKPPPLLPFLLFPLPLLQVTASVTFQDLCHLKENVFKAFSP